MRELEKNQCDEPKRSNDRYGNYDLRGGKSTNSRLVLRINSVFVHCS